MARNPDHPDWGGTRPKAGRKAPPEGKKETVTICLPPDILKKAKVTAKGRGISFSSLVEESLRAFIKATFDLPPMANKQG